MDRPETLRERVGTIIQEGFIMQKTSDEIAGSVLAEWVSECTTRAIVEEKLP